jgi:hypothetical protein
LTFAFGADITRDRSIAAARAEEDAGAPLPVPELHHRRGPRTGRNGTNTTEETAVYTRILCTSAYTAATAGNRSLALGLIDEADQDATTATLTGPERFDAAAVTVYRIGVHYALGDAGAAVAASSRVRPGQLPTPERRARYWADVARAESLYGRPDRTYHALQAAWREAPGEIRDRRSMRNLVASLVPHDRRLPGLSSFARRVGALT